MSGVIVRSMLCALLLSPYASTFAEAPSQHDPQEESPNAEVEKLLDDLDAAEATVRDAAVKGLVRIGPPVLGPLEERLLDAPTPEVVARGKVIKAAIAQKWRYWSPDGGLVCAGFQATLAPPEEQSVFVEGEPLLLELEIRNVSPDPRKMVDIRGMDLDLGDEKEQVFTSPFSDGRLVIRRRSEGNPPPRGQAVVFETGEPRKLLCKTGGYVLTPLRIDAAVSLAAGEYEIRFIYYARSKSLLEDAPDELRSNLLRVRVEPKPSS